MSFSTPSLVEIVTASYVVHHSCDGRVVRYSGDGVYLSLGVVCFICGVSHVV